MAWGGFHWFPLRDSDKVITITRRALCYLDEENLIDATLTLLNVKGVGIARATKVLGLYDQEKLCIYDSRVGKAIKKLTHNKDPIIKCPPGRSRPGDACSPTQWAKNYQKLTWTLEIIRDYLEEKGYPFRIADIEMALFMMGK